MAKRVRRDFPAEAYAANVFDHNAIDIFAGEGFTRAGEEQLIAKPPAQ